MKSTIRLRVSQPGENLSTPSLQAEHALFDDSTLLSFAINKPAVPTNLREIQSDERRLTEVRFYFTALLRVTLQVTLVSLH